LGVSLSSEYTFEKKRNTYMLNTQQLVVGIFRNRTQVEQAINELHQIGFDNRHIRFAKHGISIGGILKKIKSLYRGQNIPADGIYDDLVNIGMPAVHAHYYQSEFKAGYSIIAIQRSGVPLVATSILIRNGAYIVNEHIAQLTHYSQVTSVQEPPAEDINAELNNANESIAQSADNGQDTSIREPLAEDRNAELNSANESIAQSADNGQDTSIQEPTAEDVNAELNGANKPIAQSADNDQGNEIQEADKDLVNA
jgi:hypothetical protein